MSSPVAVTAGNSWLYRFLFGGPASIGLVTGTVRIANSSGNKVSEVSVSSIESVSSSRFLLWTRLTIRTARWQKYSIGGLGKRQASLIHEAIHEKAARNVLPLSKRLKRVNRQRLRLFSGERYIRHSAARAFLNEHQGVIARVRGLCRLEREKLKAIVPRDYDRFVPFTSIRTLESERKQANGSFVRSSVPKVRSAAGDAIQAPLTDEQAEAIATDEDVTLVLAGAGTGKTSVIVGKLAQLVRNQDVDPKEILVVAYNRKAACEVRERLPDDLATATVSTFHAFGRQIVADCHIAPDVSELAKDDKRLRRTIDSFLNELLEDSTQADDLIRFFLYHRAPWRSVFEFETEAEYDEYVRSVELRTLKGDLVKSFEELSVANFLAEHGVDYRYEEPYRVTTATRHHRQYRPDFYLTEHDIYIEHFALDEQCNPPRGWAGYAEGVVWKRDAHRQYGTALVETYSWQHARDSLLPSLREQLEALGVELGRVPRETLIQQLREQKNSWLSSLLAQFLNHVKTGNLSPTTLRERARRRGDKRRNQRFLDVFEQVQEHYVQLLADQKQIDFHDMINHAVDFLRKGTWQSRYRFILVDEFQDIAAGRMRLLEVLKGKDVAYFLVGDDWQSIYRFAGSDVRLVKGCGQHLAHVQQCLLSRTFRYGDGILGPSSAFIQRNPEQTQRPLRSESDGLDRGITVVFDGGPEAGAKRALQEIANDTAGEQASVLVLGRFNFSKEVFDSLPMRDLLQMDFSTIHRAKGREADYIIVLDLNDGLYGIPCRVEDDPLLELVIPPETNGALPFAEERRLFYVAMTRARKGVWLVTDPVRPSLFVMELLKENDGLRQIGEELARECPRCPNGRLKVSLSHKTMRCSSHPNCKFQAPRCPNCDTGYAIIHSHQCKGVSCTNPHCSAPIQICPQCCMGILVRRDGPFGPFVGCSAWLWSEPNCRYKKNL